MRLKVSRETLKLFGEITSLERLMLSLPVQTEIPLDDEALAGLAPLINLKELRIAQTIVKGRTLGPFTQLQSLDMDHTRFDRSEEHTSELQSPCNLVCRLLLEKKNNHYRSIVII